MNDCDLEGITECDKKISCEECQKEELVWAERWVKEKELVEAK